MTVTTTSPGSYRSAVMLFEPALFTDGAGEYRVTINVAGYVGDMNDSGLVSVWSGSGYDLSGSSGDAIWVNTQSTPFTAQGGATVSELGSLAITGTGIHTLQFTYDGTSAIGIFLGATTTAYPFPTVEYGSMELALVPEPSSAMLGGMALCALLLRRKRR